VHHLFIYLIYYQSPGGQAGGLRVKCGFADMRIEQRVKCGSECRRKSKLPTSARSVMISNNGQNADPNADIAFLKQCNLF